MYVLKATFDPSLALNKVSEMLALGDEPERLAEKLNLPGDTERIRKGVEQSEFKRLLQHIDKLRQYLEFEKQIAQIQSGKWAFNFMGKGYAEKKVNALKEKRRKLGSLIEAPRWFYKQERIRLLAAIRDFAMEISEQGDAEWIDVEVPSLHYPIVDMFENGDVNKAKELIAALEKPFGEIDPKFVLVGIEGNRTLNFDFDKSLVTFYVPPRLDESA